MNRPFWGFLLLASALLFVSGCSDSKSESKGEAGTSGAATEKTEGDGSGSAATVHLLTDNVAKKTSMEGRWILVFFERNMGAEIPAALLDVAKSSTGSKLKVIVKGFSPMLSNPHVKQASATDNSVHLLLEMTVQAMGQNHQPTQETKTLDIVVELHDGLARGSAQFEPTDVFVVAMVPTELDNIQNLRPQQLPEAVELKGSKDITPEQIMDKLVEFIHAHPQSPLTLEWYPLLFRGAASRKTDQATLESEAEKYTALAEHWSNRITFKSHIDVATSLISTGYMPQVSLKQIEIASKNLTEERIPVWKSLLRELKEAAESNLALAQIRSGTPQEKAKAAEILRARAKVQPYNPIALFELTQYDESQGKKQEALRGYAELVVLPLFGEILNEAWANELNKPTPPKESAQNLWKDLHGGKLDGFDAYLDQVYAEAMPKWNGKRVDARAPQSDNRLVLCELFTGADCNTCVAADIAFGYLLKTYPTSDVVGLQYHQHIPHPDPLANSDTEQRFQFYFPERGGTPTFGVSGKMFQAGGLLHQVDDVYKMLRAQVDLMLLRKTSVHIQLKAEPKDGVVAVTAEAKGSFSESDPVRLRLVLAEDHVAMRGSNGIRDHKMVVRAMPGGTGGVELKDGKLRYEGKVDVKAIKQGLDDYLRAYEEAQKTTFPSKPLDLDHLHLIAFVQNEQTKEIYQAASIPFPTGAAPTATPKSQAAAEKPSAVSAPVSKAPVSNAAVSKAAP